MGGGRLRELVAHGGSTVVVLDYVLEIRTVVDFIKINQYI